MTANHLRSTLLFGIAVLALGACATDAETGELEVRFAAGASLNAAAFSASALNASELGSVPLADVQSINVVVVRVEALPEAGDSTSAGDWVSLDVQGGGAVDLKALPSTVAGGILLARAEVPAGRYRNVRLFLGESPTITFNKQVSVGQRVFASAQAHPLNIPSSAQSGLKVPGASFEVADSGDGTTVEVLFDAVTSVQNVTATGSGTVMMSPVLSARSR